MTGPNIPPVLLTADETAEPRRSGGSAAPRQGTLAQSRARPDVEPRPNVDPRPKVDLPPAIVDIGLPAQGSTSTGVIDDFSLQFSEDLYDVAVNNASSYDLRAAGGDGSFTTGDDAIYTILS